MGSSRVATDRLRSVANPAAHGIGPAGRHLEADEQPTSDRDGRIIFDDRYSSDVEVALPRIVECSLTAQFVPLAGVLQIAGSPEPLTRICFSPAEPATARSEGSSAYEDDRVRP